MVSQAEEGARGEADVIALGDSRAMLSVFDIAELLERAMIRCQVIDGPESIAAREIDCF